MTGSARPRDCAELHSARTIGELAQIAIDLMLHASSADGVIFALTDNERGRCAGAFSEGCDLPRYMPTYESLWHENPLGQRAWLMNDESVCRLDDAMERHELMKLAFYSEYLHAAHIEDMMTGYMARRGEYRLALTAVRSTGRFNSDERDALEQVRRHAVAAFWNFSRIARLSSEPVTVGDLLHSGLNTAMIIRDEMSATDLRPRQIPPLTPTEKKVLLRLTEGKSNADIASQLGSSIRTVHKHVEHILEKLCVENRTAAVVRALALRLLD